MILRGKEEMYSENVVINAENVAINAAATGSLALPRKERHSHVVQDFLTGNLRVYKGEVMGLNHCHTVLQHLNKHIRP